MIARTCDLQNRALRGRLCRVLGAAQRKTGGVWRIPVRMLLSNAGTRYTGGDGSYAIAYVHGVEGAKWIRPENLYLVGPCTLPNAFISGVLDTKGDVVFTTDPSRTSGSSLMLDLLAFDKGGLRQVDDRRTWALAEQYYVHVHSLPRFGGRVPSRGIVSQGAIAAHRRREQAFLKESPVHLAAERAVAAVAPHRRGYSYAVPDLPVSRSYPWTVGGESQN